LGVPLRTAQRWVRASRLRGDDGLAAKPHKGAAPKLTDEQQLEIFAWVLCYKPRNFGFTGEPWALRRLAEARQKRLGVRFNANDLCDWVRQRGLSPQKPKAVPRERDQAAIDAWISDDTNASRQGLRWGRADRGHRLVVSTPGATGRLRRRLGGTAALDG